MRRYSPVYRSPPRRGYGGGGGRRGRSPPRRGYGGSRHKEQNNGSLLVRNIPLDCRPEELRAPFERFGLVRDVYIPKNYYTGEPRGFAFVQFVDPYDASEAQYHMNGCIFAGREISVVVAAETRKRPEEMRQRSRVRGPVGYGGQSSSYYEENGAMEEVEIEGRSWSRSVSRSHSPHYHPGSRSQYHSRSFSPAPRRRSDYPISPKRHLDQPRSPRGPPEDLDSDQNHRSYSPGYGNDADFSQNSRYGKKPPFESGAGRGQWRSPPRRASRSPPGSRSRSADLSPRHGR